MATPSVTVRAWARQLLTVEAASPSASEPQTVRVLEKLRISLTRFIGAEGFTALLRRALALARAEVPALQTVKVTGNGRLEGLQEFAADRDNYDAAAAITAHLLELLVTFIGESLTLRLVRDAWPDASLDQ